MGRGFGIPATEDAGRASSVARACERLGYTSVWSNDIPKADGLLTAANMLAATERVWAGVGVVACDRRRAPEIARRIKELGIPLDRFVLGIGAGGAGKPRELVAEAERVLREELGPAARIGFAAMGPRMCRLAGSKADLVLFNWMIPEWIEKSSALVTEGAKSSGKQVERAAYIRVAIGPGAEERLVKEAGWYNRIPAYRRHFAAMGVALNEVGVTAGGQETPARLAGYDRVLDEAIVRALPADESLASTLAVAEAAAPSG